MILRPIIVFSSFSKTLKIFIFDFPLIFHQVTFSDPFSLSKKTISFTSLKKINFHTHFNPKIFVFQQYHVSFTPDSIFNNKRWASKKNQNRYLNATHSSASFTFIYIIIICNTNMRTSFKIFCDVNKMKHLHPKRIIQKM